MVIACNPQQPKEASQEQKYEVVEAKRKFYYDDGTRSYGEYEPFQTRTVESLPGFNPETSTEFSKYGGLKNIQWEATGYFHVKKVKDRWWAVDPLGHPYINMAINSVNRGKSARNQKALQEKFVDGEGWIIATADLLHQYGFNSTGSWSDYAAVRMANEVKDQPLAYTVNLNFMSNYADERGGTWQVPGHKAYPNDAIFVFDPEFETFCDQHARQVVEYKDDPNLFGYFSDNEMPFKQDALEGYLTLENPEDPGLLAAKAWLEEQGVSRDSLSTDLKDEFRAYVADRYFSIVNNALKKYDPNHMYLGARFYSSEKHNEAFMRAAGKYLDVVSCNYYNHWTPSEKHMEEWASWTDKPFIVTEYYTKGEDSGMPNQSGAGWIVKTQKDRGLFYQNFCLSLLESKNCVGWHYFKYQDNDPTLEGAELSNIDANKGIVNNFYEPWTPMLEEMKKLNTSVYNLVNYFDAN